MEKKIENAFKKFYPNKRLLACKINDFYITIGFDSGDKESEIQQEAYFFGDKRDTDGKMTKFRELVGVGAYTFWHTCWSNTGVQPDKR